MPATQWISTDLLSRVRRYLPNPGNTDFPATADIYTALQEGTLEFSRDLLMCCPWLLMQAPTLMVTGDAGVGVIWLYGTDADGNPISPFGGTSIYRRKEDVKDFPLEAEVDYYDEGTQIRMPANRADPISFPDGAPYYYGAVPQVYVDATHNPNVQPVDARMAIVWKAVETLLIGLGADESKAEKRYETLKFKIICSEQLAQQNRGALIASRNTQPARFRRLMGPYVWGRW